MDQTDDIPASGEAVAAATASAGDATAALADGEAASQAVTPDAGVTQTLGDGETVTGAVTSDGGILDTLADMLNVFGDPQMLHSVTVHLPVVLAMLGVPLVLAALLTPQRMRSLRWMALGCYALLVASAKYAERTGEAALNKIPNTLPASIWSEIHQHRDLAERVWIFALITGLLVLVGIFVKRNGVYRGVMIAALAVSGYTALWVAVTGHNGGELIYDYGLGAPALIVETHQARGAGKLTGDAIAMNVSGGMSSSDTIEIRPLEEAEIKAISYENDVRPIFDDYCVACHNPKDAKGKFDLTTYDMILAGGAKEGPAILPGHPDSSPLISYVLGHLQPQMPEEELPLSSDHVHKLRLWIAAGAPGGERPEDGALASRSSPVGEKMSSAIDPAADTSDRIKPKKVFTPFQESFIALMSNPSEDERWGLLRDLRHNYLSQVNTKFSISRRNREPNYRFALLDDSAMRRFQRVLRMPYMTPPPEVPQAAAEAENPIDRFVVRHWERNGFTDRPPRTSDQRFLRRVYLDVTGAIPTRLEARMWLDDTDPAKRERLIDKLLARTGDYAANWVPYWEDLLCSNVEVPFKFGWHGDYHDWLYRSFEENRPFDFMVTELFDRSMPDFQKKYILRYSHADITQSVANAAQVFLGMSLRCSQCHNNFDNREFTQTRFLAFAGYFAPTDMELIRCDEHTGRRVPTKFFFDVPGVKEVVPEAIRARSALGAQLMVDPTSPLFAKTIVNRLWKRFMGLGLYEPTDDFRFDREASQPALLEWLADDFVQHGYDIKRCIRMILTSETYQLAYDPEAEDHFDENDLDAPRYSRSPSLRRMTGEQFVDSVRVALGEPWQGEKREFRKRATTALTRSLGVPSSRTDVIMERNHHPGLVQALELMNGEEFNFLISNSPTVKFLAKRLGEHRDFAKTLDELYWFVLNRPPTEVELEIGVDYVVGIGEANPTGHVSATDVVADAIWVLATSPEFIYIQ